MKHLFVVVCMLLLAGTTQAGSASENSKLQQKTASPSGGAIRFYQKFLSGADGHRCPMTPSCSNYALQAIRRHGIVRGWIMSSDRLMRCGRDELDRGPKVNTPAGIRCKDPVSNNDFWWH